MRRIIIFITVLLLSVTQLFGASVECPSQIVVATDQGTIGTLDPVSLVFTPKMTDENGAFDYAGGSDCLVYGYGVDGGIYQYNLTAENSTVIGNTGVPFNFGGGVSWGPNDLLYAIITQNNTPALYTVDPKTAKIVNQTVIHDFKVHSGDLSWVPSKEAFYVTNGLTGNVYTVTLDGTAKHLSSSDVLWIYAMAYFNGTLYAYDRYNYQYTIDIDTGVIDTANKKRIKDVVGSIVAGAD